MPSHTPPQPQHHPSPLSILTPRLYHPLSRCPSMPWVRTPRRSQWMEIPSQLQPQLNGTSGFHVFSGFSSLFFERFSSQPQSHWAEVHRQQSVQGQT